MHTPCSSNRWILAKGCALYHFVVDSPRMTVKKANMASTPVKSSFLGFFIFKIVMVKIELTIG